MNRELVALNLYGDGAGGKRNGVGKKYPRRAGLKFTLESHHDRLTFVFRMEKEKSEQIKVGFDDFLNQNECVCEHCGKLF